MSKTFTEVRIKHKFDTDANWTSNNPILLDGEIILSDTADGVRMKMGDGTTRYAALPFADELVRSFVAANYVTKTELATALSALNLGFSVDETDMKS